MSTAATSYQPAIAPVSKEEAAPQVHAIYDKLTHVFGHMPGIFGTMARVPDALVHFMSLYGAVIDKGSVEARYKELAYLKTSQINGCEYCFRAHSASGKKRGISEEQLEALAFYRRSAAFDEKEKAVLLFAERVTRGASAMRERGVAELKQYFSDDQIVELTLAIAVANFTNRFNDALVVTPDIG